MSQFKRVVITGMGAVTPIGLTVQEFSENLFAGKSGAAMITSFDTSRVETKFACELKGFDPANFMDKKTARRLDPFCQYAIAAVRMALADGNVDPNTMSIEEKENVGVLIGSGIGGLQTMYTQSLISHEQGPKRISPFFIPMLIPDIAGGHVSIEYGFKGPNQCVVTACATANNNMIDAFLMVRSGMADMIIAGGAEAGICELGIGGFNAARALSTRNDSPETASRPFDSTRDGFVMGDGSGILIIESLDNAVRRGAKIYAEMIAGGLSADAHHITAPDPDGRGAALAMLRALKTANLNTTEIDHINMHGTSTGLGDIAETKAIKAVFGEYAKNISLSATKSMTGHLLGATGAIEAIASLLAIQKDMIPPTINFEHPDPECDLNYTFHKAQKRTVNVAMSNAFGFGGHNTTVIFKKFEK